MKWILFIAMLTPDGSWESSTLLDMETMVFETQAECEHAVDQHHEFLKKLLEYHVSTRWIHDCRELKPGEYREKIKKNGN